MEEPLEPQSPRKRQRVASPAETSKLSEGTTSEHVGQTAVKDASTLLSAADIQLRKETEVGITEFVSPDLPGFTGVLKKRYTDFLVNEILPSGQVLHLDNLKVPSRGQQTSHAAQTETESPALVKQLNDHSQRAPQTAPESTAAPAEAPDTAKDESEPFELSSEDEAVLSSFFGAEVTKSVVALHEQILKRPNAKPREHGTVRSAVINDRELRGKIHQAVRRIFSSRLETSTDDDGGIIVSAASTSTRNGWGTKANGAWQDRHPQKKGKLGWQELGGEYLHFTLYKENKDTMEVISYLARQTKMKPQSFQFAGTKDRRGVTVQRVSVYRVYADRMVGLNRTLRGSKIGGYEYHPRGLELGELKGNEFVITLRDCSFPSVEVSSSPSRVDLVSTLVGQAVQQLGKRGFINYYGLQRFGTFSTRTDTIGLKMLKGDFHGAVEAILNFSPDALAAAQDPLSSMSGNDLVSSDDKARAHALHSFKRTGKIHPAIDDLPRKFSAEASIIRHLGGGGRNTDYLGALQTVPRNLRLMYVHAYQSLVWNIAAGERWKKYGEKVVEGDLVLVDEHKNKTDKEMHTENVDADGEIIVNPAADDSATSVEDMFVRARALSEEEAASGAYSIFDVVLPSPGYDILYPANDMAEIYKTFMASERGGGLDPYDMRRKWKDVSLSGSYRKLLARPENCSFEVRDYVREDEQFVETDLQKLEGKGRNAAEDGSAPGQPQVDPDSEKPAKIAVILKLQLGSSQYATMALRELMKFGGVKTYKPDFGGGR